MFLSVVGFLAVLVIAVYITGGIGMLALVAPTFSGQDLKWYEYLACLIVLIAVWWFVYWICPFTLTVAVS